MPLIGEFHGFYFNISDTNAAPVHIGRGGYPGWQASVVTPSMLGMLGAWIDTWVARLKWHGRLACRLHRTSEESRQIVLRVMDALEHPAYPTAREAVRKTAVTLGFNNPDAWKFLSRAMKDDPGRAENVFRHLHAMQLLRTSQSSTLTNPQQNLLVELAYQGFAIRGR